MNAIGIIILVILGIFFGIMIGILGVYFMKMLSNIKDKKNLQKVLEGKRPNNYTLDDGKVIQVTKFRIPSDKGVDVLISLKGGIDVEEDAESKFKNKDSGNKESKKSSSRYSIFRR